MNRPSHLKCCRAGRVFETCRQTCHRRWGASASRRCVSSENTRTGCPHIPPIHAWQGTHYLPSLIRLAIILAVSLHAASFAAADGPSDSEQRLLQRGPARQATAADRPRPFPADNKTSIVHMFWPLCAILLIVGLCVLAVRKWMPQARRLGGGDAIKVLARHHLSGRQSLCLVRLGRRAVLLGVTNERISALSQIDDPEEVASLVAVAQRARPGSFTTMLSKFTTADPAPNPDHPADDRIIQEGPLVSSQNLASTGRTIRGLIDRVRVLSSQTLTPTESA